MINIECDSGQLSCKDGAQCVPSDARCNGISDCADDSDEEGCESTTATSTRSSGLTTDSESDVTIEGIQCPIHHPHYSSYRYNFRFF